MLVIAFMATLGTLAAQHHFDAPQLAEVSGKSTTPAIPTPSPTPTPTPSPSVTPPPAAPATPGLTGRKRLGLSVGDTLPGLSSAELNKRLDDFVALGVGWVRLDLDWNNIQPRSADTYNWGDFDRVTAALKAHNLTPLVIVTYTPPWARRSDCAQIFSCRPADPNQFANFAGAAAARYAPRGIKHWEIWNEENAGFYKPAPDVSGYVSLLAPTYRAIKAVDSTSTVLLGGLASTDYSEGGIPQLDFLNQVYAAGGKAYFDGVAYHPYSFPVPTSYNISWSAWTKMAGTATSIRSIMAANGDSGKGVWVTEYGAPSNGPGVGATAGNYHLDDAPDHVDEALQAIMAKSFVTSLSAMPWIPVGFWYSYKDIGTAASDTENFYGLRRADNSPKPSYEALKAAIAGM